MRTWGRMLQSQGTTGGLSSADILRMRGEAQTNNYIGYYIHLQISYGVYVPKIMKVGCQ